ncbi:glycosyltransferase [Paenibacillus sp. LMG 31460]|uniref:Glycosyltransferase n=1 Tax=Paenibacillus germinis TaxID=2654979 RepID=A0ABX1Z6J6_9BACL|nr:glycosyltransferase family 4 protein [Paenibacillus germinis]NOU89005.1 glycosyltransferase [Paenibacillus germinis]
MKVWIVTNAYLPEKGGLVSYTRNIALQLLREGKEVEIITSNLKNTSLPSYEEMEGVKVSRIDYSGVPKVLKPFSPLAYYYRTLKFIRKCDIKKDDVVISRFYTFALAVVKGKNVNKHIFVTPLIATKLQHIEAKETKYFFKKLYFYFILPQLALLDKLAIKHSPFVGVLSRSKQEEVASYYRLKRNDVFVIPPGVDMERFRVASTEEKNELRSKLGYSAEDKIVICVSRLSSEKNLEIIIHCINAITDKTIKLAFVGDGDCEKGMEELIIQYKLQDQIKLWGARQNVEDYYRMADVFILPSKYEGFGHVYLEAMACGLPCIAARSNPPITTTASGEIIVNDRLGVLVNYDSKEEIVSAIDYCLNTAVENQSYRRQFVQDNYSWRKHYNDVERIFLNGTNKTKQ